MNVLSSNFRPLSRREFLIGLGSVSGFAVWPADNLGNIMTAVSSQIRFGYAAITWGGADLQAIKDIGEVGFRGVQLRANVMRDFGDKPKALAAVLKKHRLQFVALSGGGPRGDAYQEPAEIATQLKHAAFLRDAGGLYLQMTDSARPKDRKPGPADFRKLGRLLTEVGKRTADLGIPMAYHNHMHSIGEAPDEVDALMDVADPRYVKLLLDVAHFTQGGGDPAGAIREYGNRILFLHIKDVETIAPKSGVGSYRFVELGRGRVDLQAVFAALRETRFRGWAIVELDSVPDNARTPKESAVINKNYLQHKLGMEI